MVFARDAAGRPTQIIGAATDVTERRRAEARQSLMVRELDHRVKNNLSTVLALIESTARTTQAVEQYRDALRKRIESLTAVHALLARSGWQGASVQDLARTAVAPFAPRGRDCLTVLGGEAVIAPPLATPLCMAMHELATNASKHGALSNGTGRVTVRARADGEVSPALLIEWMETGGPAVSPVERRGLGLSLIEGLVRHELGGRAQSRFAPEGVTWELWIPLDRRRHAGASREDEREFDGAPGPLPSTA
jgi:two-component sensor histidine kinase